LGDSRDRDQLKINEPEGLEESMVDANHIVELSHLAKQLNAQTDNLNKSIRELNRQLAGLNIGTEYWLQKPLESTGIRQDSSYSPARKYQIDTYLGYDKIGDDWQLAIKEVTTDYEWDREDGLERPVTEIDYTGLLSVSRDVRLLAAKQFNGLLDGLKRHVQEKLQSIKWAEKLAQLK
jgi:hypothetical protein